MSGVSAPPPGPPAPRREWVMARALERPPAPPLRDPAALMLRERRIAEALGPLMPPGAAVDGAGWDASERTAGPAWLADQPVGRRTRTWDVTLVVDTGLSMRFWQPVVEGVGALLVDHGLSRTPVPRPLDAGGPDRGRAGAEHGVVLVLTDGLSAGWYTGEAGARLHEWGAELPVAVVHLLPENLWPSSGITVRPRALHMTGMGAPAAGTRWEQGVAGMYPVPVLPLDGQHLQRWARYLSRGPGTWTNLPTLLVGAEPAGRAVLPAPADGEADASAPDLLHYFASSASPAAQVVAAGLAAAPLTLPVMRRVLSLLAPGSGPELLSEIFLAGLLRPAAPGHGTPAGPDAIAFDFPDGVRELLLSSVGRSENVAVFEDVFRFLDRESGVAEVRGWDRLLRDPEGVPLGTATAGSAPFLQVQLAVLDALSGPYRRRAQRLRAQLAAAASQATQAGARTAAGRPPDGGIS